MKNSMEPEDFAGFIASYNDEPHRALRINTLKGKAFRENEPYLKQAFSLEAVDWCENGYYYDENSFPGKHPLHEAGAYYIQEASAMAPAAWLNVRPGMRVLDLCASPGGKATFLAEKLENTGFLLANEINKPRAGILSLNIERMGIGNALVANESPDKLAEIFQGYFDRILVDAPCSGEGMFRKNPEAVNEWSLENVSRCAERQNDILKNAAKMLCPGGIMVYSTCTFSEEENERVIEAFLEREKDFYILKPDNIRLVPDGFLLSEIRLNGEKQGHAVRLLPHRIKGEGHFFAVLERQGFTPQGNRTALSGSLTPAPDRVLQLFNAFVKEYVPGFDTQGGIIHSFGEQLYLSNAMMPGIRGLSVLRPGLHLGTIKKDRFEPGHALALFLPPDKVSSRAVLPDEDKALSFLKGQSLSTEYMDERQSSPAQKGWCLVSYMGCSLGWGKNDGRIIKNHYPKGLRIA